MAAIAGFESSMRVGPIGPSPPSLSALGRPAAIAFRSAPAQKVPPAPVSTATCSVSSASKDRKASASAAAVAASTALRASGRLMVTVRMESLRLVSTDGISIHLPLPAQGPNLTVTVCHIPNWECCTICGADPPVCAGLLDPLQHPAPPREQRGHTAGRYNGRAYEDDRRLSHCPHSRSSRRAGRHACPDSSACLAPDAVGRVPPAFRHSHRGSPRRSQSAPSRRLPCQRARRAHRLAVEGLRIGPFLRPPQRHRAGLKRTVYCPRPSRGLRTGGHHARRTHPIPNAGGLVLRRPDAAPTPSSGNRKPDAPRRRLRHALRPHRRLPPLRLARPDARRQPPLLH